MSERSRRFEKVAAWSLAVIVGGTALAGCRGSTVSANQSTTPPTASESALPTTATAPDVLDIGKLRRQLGQVPASVRQASNDVLRVTGQSCNDAGCALGYMGTTFGVDVRGKRYEVTAGHAEKVAGLTCHDQFLEGWAGGQTFGDRIVNRAGTFRYPKGNPEEVDYSVPDLGMFQPAPSAALNRVGVLSLAASGTYLEPGTAVWMIGYHPDQHDQIYNVTPPPTHPQIDRKKNIAGGIVIGNIAGPVPVTEVLEVMGGVVQGDSGGPVMADGIVYGVNSSVSEPETAAQVEQDTGLTLKDYPVGQKFRYLYVQDVDQGSAGQLAASLQARVAC